MLSISHDFELKITIDCKKLRRNQFKKQKYRRKKSNYVEVATKKWIINIDQRISQLSSDAISTNEQRNTNKKNNAKTFVQVDFVSLF